MNVIDDITYFLAIIVLFSVGYVFFRILIVLFTKSKDEILKNRGNKLTKIKAKINNDRNELDQLIKKYYHDMGMNLNVLPSKLEKRALEGDVEYMFDFANILVEPLDQGIIDKKYEQISYYWMKKAAELGNEPALSYICLWHLTDSNNLMNSDYEEGLRIYNQLRKSKEPYIVHMVNLMKDYVDSDNKQDFLRDAESKINNFMKNDGEAKLEFIVPAFELTDKLISEGSLLESDRILFAQFCVEKVLGSIYPKNFNVSDSFLYESYESATLSETMDKWKEYKYVASLRDDFSQLQGKSLDEIKTMNFELFIK